MKGVAFRARQSGLTLVEMLVAAALSAVVVTAALATMTSSQRLTDVSVNQSGRIDELQALGALLGDDVRAATAINLQATAPAGLPASVPGTQATQALLLSQPAGTGTPCALVNQIAYLILPRSALTVVPGTLSAVDSWLRLMPDSQNTDQRVLLRAWTCDTAVRTRLVADYLDSPQFSISLRGQTTFQTTPGAATAGVQYGSVQLNVASRRVQRGQAVRVPQTGTLRFVAASRVLN